MTGISQITASAADTFTETWNGKAWTATAIAAPRGEPFSLLWDVACPAAGVCGTVGSAGASLAGAGTAQALGYDGKTWSRQAVPAARRDGSLPGMAQRIPSSPGVRFRGPMLGR